MTRDSLRRISGIVLLVVFVVAAAKYVDFAPLFNTQLKTLGELLVVILATVFLRAHLIKVSVRSQGITLSFVEWFGLNVYSSLLNLLLPLRAGLSIKGVYLKKVHGLKYAAFVGLQGGLNLLQLIFILLSGAILLFVIGLRENSAIIALVVAILCMTVSAMILVIRNMNENSTYRRTLATAYRSFIGLARNTSILLRLVFDNVLILALAGFAFYLAMNDIGYHIGILSALFTIVAITIVNIVNLTPGNLGVQEFGAAYISQMLGGSFDAGFIAMLLVRCVSVSCWLLLSPFIFSINFRLAHSQKSL